MTRQEFARKDSAQEGGIFGFGFFIGAPRERGGAGAGGRDDRTLLRRRKKIRALFIPLTLAAGSSSPSSPTSSASSPFLEQRSPLSWCQSALSLSLSLSLSLEFADFNCG